MHRAAHMLLASAPDRRARPTRSIPVRPILFRYGLALLLVSVAVAISLPLRPAIYTTPLFFVAVVVSSWYGGIGPGIVAVLASTAAINYFFEHPLSRFGFGLHDIPRLVEFVLIATVVSFLTAARHRVDGELRQSRDLLKAEVERRRALNVELEKRSEELQATNKELEAFAYSVSHDLRAPVRHIAGFTELLQKHSGAVLDEKSRHHIDMILDAANRMGGLVDDLLAFSRIGRSETQKTTVKLEQLVKEIVSEMAPDTKDRKIAWRIGELPICYGDPAMLRLAFSNLVSNALKFTQTREQAEIEIGSLNHTPDEVVVFVKDNGVGFDMKYKDKLFGVFQRLHSQEAFEGTGIGLATVQRIIHQHGGKVWPESSIDRGATFYVSLPKHGKVDP